MLPVILCSVCVTIENKVNVVHLCFIFIEQNPARSSCAVTETDIHSDIQTYTMHKQKV